MLRSKKTKSHLALAANMRFRPFKLTEEILKEIEILGGHGADIHSLRFYYGVDEKKYYALVEKDPRIINAIFRGRTKMSYDIGSLLTQKAKAGNVTAQMFYLRTQGGWTERQESPRLTEPPRVKVIPKNLGTDPVEASRRYQEIMK